LDIESKKDYDFDDVAKRFLASSRNTPSIAGDKFCSLRPRDLANKHAGEAMELVDHLVCPE